MGGKWYQDLDRPMTSAERTARYRKLNPEKIKENNDNRNYIKYTEDEKIRNKKNPAKYLYRIAKHRAKSKGLDFSISVEDIIIPTHCPVFGWELIVRSDKLAAHNSASIDRKNSTKGYIPGNIEVISYRANVLKRNGTLEEFEALVEYLRKSNH